jgi:hypothetical protein
MTVIETFDPIGRFAVGKRVYIISDNEMYEHYKGKVYKIVCFIRGDHAILEGFGPMPLYEIELV